MPSIYAHWYFGQKAKTFLPKRIQQAVADCPELYQIGLQGPDILFYYKPLKRCKINRIGYELHERPAKEFFSEAKAAYERTDNKTVAMSYLAGFLAHYSLDRMCHGYIEKKLSVSRLTHTEIESEFDRYLLDKERMHITKNNMTAYIVPSEENANIIAAFFSDISAPQIRKALKSMKFYNRLLNSNGICRCFVDAAFHLSGNYRELHGMMMADQPLPESEDSNLRLEKLLQKALTFYGELSAGYHDFLQGGNLPAGLEDTFGPGDDWKRIPVFPPEKEKFYEI